jgi:hypothetical protein
MKVRTIWLAFGVATLGLAAGCSSASHTATVSASSATAVAAPSVTTDPYGETCPTLDSSGYCPGDDPATDPNGQTCQNTEVGGNGGYCPGDSPSPTQQTDPSGQQCTTLDSLGYCPGDDPTDPNGKTCRALDSLGYCPGDDPQPDKVTFIVSGSYANVTYGPAGSDYTGSVPMDVTNTIPSQPPIYYAIDAQLQGGGTVSCKIEVDGQTISQATAQGGYNIATCEISQDPLSGGWTDTNSS